MNIFYLSNNIEKCVRYHVDKHVVKMPTETAQILSASSRLLGIDQGYKLSHEHHPCVHWAMKSRDNWDWLRRFGIALCDEYTYRYGRIHAAREVITSMINPVKDSKGFTDPPQCMPDDYKGNNAVWAYRTYYKQDKRKLFSWKGREVPLWIDFDFSIENYIEIECDNRIYQVSKDYRKVQSILPKFIYVRIYYELNQLDVLTLRGENRLKLNEIKYEDFYDIIDDYELESFFYFIQSMISLGGEIDV